MRKIEAVFLLLAVLALAVNGKEIVCYIPNFPQSGAVPGAMASATLRGCVAGANSEDMVHVEFTGNVSVDEALKLSCKVQVNGTGHFLTVKRLEMTLGDESDLVMEDMVVSTVPERSTDALINFFIGKGTFRMSNVFFSNVRNSGAFFLLLNSSTSNVTLDAVRFANYESSASLVSGGGFVYIENCVFDAVDVFGTPMFFVPQIGLFSVSNSSFVNCNISGNSLIVGVEHSPIVISFSNFSDCFGGSLGRNLNLLRSKSGRVNISNVNVDYLNGTANTVGDLVDAFGSELYLYNIFLSFSNEFNGGIGDVMHFSKCDVTIGLVIEANEARFKNLIFMSDDTKVTVHEGQNVIRVIDSNLTQKFDKIIASDATSNFVARQGVVLVIDLKASLSGRNLTNLGRMSVVNISFLIQNTEFLPSSSIGLVDYYVEDSSSVSVNVTYTLYQIDQFGIYNETSVKDGINTIHIYYGAKHMGSETEKLVCRVNDTVDVVSGQVAPNFLVEVSNVISFLSNRHRFIFQAKDLNIQGSVKLVINDSNIKFINELDYESRYLCLARVQHLEWPHLSDILIVSDDGDKRISTEMFQAIEEDGYASYYIQLTIAEVFNGMGTGMKYLVVGIGIVSLLQSIPSFVIMVLRYMNQKGVA